jgi:hypothetical protein
MIAETEIPSDETADGATLLSDEALARLRNSPKEYAAWRALLAEPRDPLVLMAIEALADLYEGRTTSVEDLIASSACTPIAAVH